MSVRLLSALAALTAALTIASPGAAQEETRSTTVSFTDLDLAKPADAARLDRRLQMAAQRVCDSYERDTLEVAREVAACETAALARARSDVQVALRSGGGARIALTRQ